jgi:hypothetical protein
MPPTVYAPNETIKPLLDGSITRYFYSALPDQSGGIMVGERPSWGCW